MCFREGFVSPSKVMFFMFENLVGNSDKCTKVEEVAH